MSKIVNDTVVAVSQAVEAAMKASDTAEAKASIVARSIMEMLGDVNRTGKTFAAPVVWAKSPESFKQVKDHTLSLLELDAKTVAASVKDAKDSVTASKMKTTARAKAGMVEQALRLVGALAIMEDRSGLPAMFDGSVWTVPAAWYVNAEDYEVDPVGKDRRAPYITFKSRRGADQVRVTRAKGEKAGEPTVIAVSASVGATIALAYAKPSRNKSDKAKDNANVPALKIAAETIRDVVAKDDYKIAFTGEAADDVGNMIAALVRNDALWRLALAERQDYEAKVAKGDKAA